MQRLGEFGVGQPAGDQRQHLPLSLGELVQAPDGVLGLAVLAWSAKCAMSRRVTLGASSASPAATVRIALSSSSSGRLFSAKPLAPARSASKTYSSRSNVVRISTRDPTGRG